ncbi:MAG: DUF1015 family protein [Phycisphaerales bacterium]|nr:DUF1015 family protein [Phycisphaerales bacterium]
MRIQPFHRIHPLPSRASAVSSPPYDVVTTAEARALAENRLESFLHVIRPEIDLPEGTAWNDAAVYDKATENLQQFIETGVLQRDETPTIAIYRLSWEGRSQYGIVCTCHVDDYLQGIIKKHEETRPDKEDDRTRHLLALDAHTGPLMLTFRDREDITSLLALDTTGRPDVHFKSTDGVTHTLWTVAEPQQWIEAFASMPEAYIADGHHRAASAARAAATRRTECPDADGDAEFNWFLGVLFPASQLNVLAYNRLVTDLGGLSEASLLERLSAIGRIEPCTDSTPDRKGAFCLALPSGWHRLELDADPDADPVARLDAALLQDRVFSPILGIEDPRTDSRLQFVGGIKGPEELMRRVEAGEASLGISMYPTSIDDMMDVSDAALSMPPKSTWFEPKLRSGLFLHAMDSAQYSENNDWVTWNWVAWT